FVDDPAVPSAFVWSHQDATATDPGFLLLDLVLLGRSTGAPEQTFDLGVPTVADDAVDVFTLEPGGAGGWHAWRPVPDFDASGGRDADFVVDGARGRILLGDGDHGRLPP